MTTPIGNGYEIIIQRETVRGKNRKVKIYHDSRLVLDVRLSVFEKAIKAYQEAAA
jgi:hypothetical protein